jgi:AcrR family transcriptional regulator
MARTAGSHGALTGPRIRTAARKLFARHGFAAVSMRQLAAEVGVQAGALYLYIADKQSLLYELMREHMETLIAAWEEEPKGDGPLEALEAFTRFHIRFNLERPDAVFLSYMELRNLTPKNYRAIARLRSRYEAELEAILKEGAARGVLQVPDTKLATMAVIAMLTGVNTWYREGGRLSRDRVEAIYLDMVRRSVGAGAGAGSPPVTVPE